MKSLTSVASIIVVVCAVSTTYADPNHPAEAKRLFEEGRELLEADHDEACERFEESYRFERAPDTALALAECAERDGNHKRAWKLYKAAARMLDDDAATRSAQGQLARDRAEALRAAHPEIDRQREEPRSDQELTGLKARNLTPFKVAAVTGLGLGAVAMGISVHAYMQASAYQRSRSAVSAAGEPLTNSSQCGQDAAAGDPNAGAWNRACSAHARSKFTIPASIGFGLVGVGALIYVLVAEPEPERQALVVAPTMTPDGAGAMLQFDW